MSKYLWHENVILRSVEIQVITFREPAKGFLCLSLNHYMVNLWTQTSLRLPHYLNEIFHFGLQSVVCDCAIRDWLEQLTIFVEQFAINLSEFCLIKLEKIHTLWALWQILVE